MAKAHKIENFQRKLRPNPLFFSFVDTDQVLVGSGKKASLAARSKGRGRELRALTEQGRSKGDSAVLFSRKNGHMKKKQIAQRSYWNAGEMEMDSRGKRP